MSPPTNVSELRRFMGMVNQLGKITKQLADLSQPLRKLLSKGAVWQWDESQDEAFDKIKQELSKQILALYDPQKDTKISADASSYRLRAILLQESESSWKPVAYASRSLTDREEVCTNRKRSVSHYLGLWKILTLCYWLLLETNHKPLVPLLGTKDLHSLPPRVLRFRLRLNRFHYEITHVPGKLLTTADTLSGTPLQDGKEVTLIEEVEEMVDSILQQLPASKDQLDKYRQAQANDTICSTVTQYCKSGWPSKNKLCNALKPYWKERGKFILNKELLLYCRRIVIPQTLQAETLEKVHKGH